MAVRDNTVMPKLADLRQMLEEGHILIIPPDAIQDKMEIGRKDAKVYKATLKSDGSKVVQKQILRDDDEKAVEQYIQDMKIFGTVRHPHLVQMTGACINPLSHVTEFVHFDLNRLGVPANGTRGLCGSNLRDFLDVLCDNDLVESVGAARGLLHKAGADIAQGLAFLHAKDIGHGGLNTGNILICNAGITLVCKIADFVGFRSRVAQTEFGDVTDDVKMRKLAFQAPEQLVDHLPKVDAAKVKKMDVWSYGMILFCLLNPDLKLPWDRELNKKPHIQSLSEAMVYHRLPDYSTKYESLHEDMDLMELYTGCCQYNPEDRPDIHGVLSSILRQLFERLYRATSEETFSPSKPKLQIMDSMPLHRMHMGLQPKGPAEPKKRLQRGPARKEKKEFVKKKEAPGLPLDSLPYHRTNITRRSHEDGSDKSSLEESDDEEF